MRNLILSLIGALSLYLCWLCIRLICLRRRVENADPVFSGSDSESLTIHSEILGDDPLYSASSVHFDSRQQTEENQSLRTEPRLNRLSEPDAGSFGFDALLELRQTRHLFDELKQRYEALESQVLALDQELKALRAASQVSPVYSEAVVLAQRGYELDAIAERCGISLAEAQLVQSLAAEGRVEGRFET